MCGLLDVTMSPLGSIQDRIAWPLLTAKQVILNSSPAIGDQKENSILTFFIIGSVASLCKQINTHVQSQHLAIDHAPRSMDRNKKPTVTRST